MTVYDYVAFSAMAIVFVAIIWLVIFLGDLPANIAKERGHSQVAAVRAMSWFGLLFTGGILWILAIVWSYFDSSHVIKKLSQTGTGGIETSDDLRAEVERLNARLEKLESRLPKQGEAS